MTRPQEHDKNLESQIQKLVKERNFAGAAALQEEIDKSRADEKFEAELARLVAHRDFTGAARLQEEKEKRADSQHLCTVEQRKTPASPGLDADKMKTANRARAAAAAARTAATTAELALEARCLVHETEITRLLAKKD